MALLKLIVMLAIAGAAIKHWFFEQDQRESKLDKIQKQLAELEAKEAEEKKDN